MGVRAVGCRYAIAVAAIAASLGIAAHGHATRWEWLPGYPKAGPAKKTFVAGLPRAEADRRDEAKGPQVHLMYVLPSDGADEHLDTNGQIATSAVSFNQWLLEQTHDRWLTLDTFHGLPDVTFVRLPRTDADLRASGVYLRDEIESGLRAMGLIREGKLYAVYYGGISDVACGGGPWPPALEGSVAALYLKGRPQDPMPCAANPLGTGVETPAYWEFSMLHELMHAMGFAAVCAPHHVLDGHVGDGTNDLMYAGSKSWRLPPELDIGRDDYYRHSTAGCLDLDSSPYLLRHPVAKRRRN